MQQAENWDTQSLSSSSSMGLLSFASNIAFHDMYI
jgi:hypothetical protein